MGLFGWMSSMRRRNRGGDEHDSKSTRTSKAGTCSTSTTSNHIEHGDSSSELTRGWRNSKRRSMVPRRRTRSSVGRLSSALLEGFDDPSSLLDLSSLTTNSWSIRGNKNDPLSNRNKLKRQKANRRRTKFLMEQVEQQNEVTNLIRGDSLLRQASGRDDTWNTSNSSLTAKNQSGSFGVGCDCCENEDEIIEA